jgi:hypothetical protein
MSQITKQFLPKTLEKNINDLARAREKAAKQKYLLDLGESMVMHLCSFVLGEYKESQLTSIDLEKSFLKNSKNVSFGIYLGWLRESSKFLNANKKPSEIHQLLHGTNDLDELSQFMKAFETLKTLVENDSEEYISSIQQALKNNLGKTNLLLFFDLFIQLRNRVAHPHKEVKGRMVTWPFSENYFDAINPYLENSLKRAIDELGKIWEFRQFIIESNDDGLLTLKNEDSDEFEEFSVQSSLPKGTKVFANPANTILLSDWKLLLKAGDEAIAKIKEEEDELRNKATIDDLKKSIEAALDDEQISLDELNFFESLGKTKLGLARDDVKKLILEVAKTMNIEDPFPDVDKRFIELIDNAINTRTYNEFLLRLTGQQYGVDSESFEKVFKERTFALNVDPEEIKKNKVLQFSMEELNSFQGLMSTQKWLMSMASLRNFTKESIYKIKDDSYVFGNKEFWHRTAFKNLELFVQSRLKKIMLDEGTEWETNQNNWQIGVMTSYAWCSFYPKNLATKRMLALHFSIYGGAWGSAGSAAIGYLPDWKDYTLIENYGLLRHVFADHLKSFAQEFAEDLKKYPNLVLWDSLNNNTYYSFTESIQKHRWFYDHLYGFDQIQFFHNAESIVENPSLLIESFDIIFNLFNGLFESVNRDYLNLLDANFLIYDKEDIIRNKLLSLEPILVDYGLSEIPTDGDEEKSQKNQEENESLEATIESNDTENIEKDGLNGSIKFGYFLKEVRSKVKGYPVVISFQINQDYLHNRLNFIIYISCAGYLESSTHLQVERVLESLQNLTFENTEFHFKRSKFLAVMPIEDIDSFDPRPLTNYFLNEFASKCASSSTRFLGLNLNSELIKALAPKTNELLDELSINLKNTFKDDIKIERRWMSNSRYIDYAYGGKAIPLWVGWGLEWRNSQLLGGVILHVRNSIKGAIIQEQMEKIAREDHNWKYLVVGDSEAIDSEWILMDDVNQYKFTASTEHSKPHTAAHGLLTNKKTYWAAKIKDSDQWWQVELKEVMTFSRMKFTGSPAGNSYMQKFDLSYSLDGKEWAKIESLDGINDPYDLKEITFDESFNAKFIRIHPLEYTGFPGFRIDFLAKKILPNKIELQWLQPVSNELELQQILNEIPSKIEELKKMNGIGI